MKSIFLCASLFLLFFRCSQSQEMSIELDKKIKVIKKIELNQDSVFISLKNTFFKGYKNTSHYVSIADFHEQIIINYNHEGNVKSLYFLKQLNNSFELPNIPPVNYTYSSDTLVLLYPNEYIYFCSQKKVLKKTRLLLPPNYQLFRYPPLYYLPSTQEVIISIGVQKDDSKSFFSESKVFAIFDANTGVLKKQFGSYPKAYAQGVSFSSPMSGTTLSILENDTIYTLQTHFPDIEMYSVKGDFLGSLKGINSPNRDTTIKINKKHIDELSEKEMVASYNDSYRGFAKALNQPIFYYTYFNHQKRKNYIARFDARRRIYQEGIIPIPEFNFLLPIANKDYCYLLNLKSNADEAYVYEIRMD
jgi:hypothetical protein